jgi:hypothetical protein
MFTFLRNMFGQRPGSGKPAAATRSRSVALQLEALEDRLTPSATVGTVGLGSITGSLPMPYTPFQVVGTSLNVHGTSGNDQFSFTAGATSETVTLNGQSYTVNPALIHTIRFDGAGGSDTAILTDQVNRATAALSPHAATLGSQSYSVLTSNTQYNYVYGNAGDTANFFDSAGNDTFAVGKNSADMFDSPFTYLNYAGGFTNINGYSSHGGQDQAVFYDSAGNDIFVGKTNFASMTDTGNTYNNTASGFASTHAYSSAGGMDTAYLYDNYGGVLVSNGSDATLISANNSGATYSNTATGFSDIEAYSSAFSDTTLFELPANYTLHLHGMWDGNQY